MSGTVIPAQPGTRAVFHLPGRRAVLRTVIGWELRTGFEPHATPITLVAKNALPGSGALGLAEAKAIVFGNGHVESVNGSKCWASVGDYCNSCETKLVGA